MPSSPWNGSSGGSPRAMPSRVSGALLTTSTSECQAASPCSRPSRRNEWAPSGASSRCGVPTTREVGVGLELAGVPDEDLLVVPRHADADVGQGREAVGLLDEQVLADGLDGVDDLREAVVVVRRLDEHLVVAALWRRRSGYAGVVDEHRELHGGEERPGRAGGQGRDAGGVARHQRRVGRQLRRVRRWRRPGRRRRSHRRRTAPRCRTSPRGSDPAVGPAPGAGGSTRRSGPS